jgi:hypothetical protein
MPQNSNPRETVPASNYGEQRLLRDGRRMSGNYCEPRFKENSMITQAMSLNTIKPNPRNSRTHSGK